MPPKERKLDYNLVRAANETGLIIEVIESALLAMKRNPELSIEEAFTIGYNAWIK